MKSVTCCFAGHRLLPKSKVAEIEKFLGEEIDELYSQGVTEFISGGAVGFDQIAAKAVLAKREQGYGIHLIFALPCKGSDEYRTDDERAFYLNLLEAADKVMYVSEKYTLDCIRKRNRYMVDSSSHCVCAMTYDKSGTGKAVRYALEKGVDVINIMDKLREGKD